MSVAHIQDVNLESDVLTVPSSQNDAPNKYIFPAFANFSGERRLETILRKIIKLGEFRTWQAAVSYQAPGMPCYVGMEKIAERSGRGIRQIQKDIASLESKGLLAIYPGWIEVEREDGTYAPRPVLIKDFSGLYRLADEYLRWIQCPNAIPAEREYAGLIRDNTDLYTHLKRFNNYRRILETEQPGRKPATDNSGQYMHEESHEWIANYNSNKMTNFCSQYRKEATGQDYKDQETNSSSAGGAGPKKEEFGTRPRTIRSRVSNIETETGTRDTTEPENQEAKPEKRNSVAFGERPGASAPASGKGKRRSSGRDQGAAEKPKLPMYLEGVVLEIAQKFNEVNVASALTRAASLYERARAAGCPDEYAFVEWMEYPRQTTADRLRARQIKRVNKADNSPAAMPLFFHLLEERVEMREAQQAEYEEERQRLEAQQREWEQEAQAPESRQDEDQATTSEEGEASTPHYIQRVEQIVLDAGEAEHLEISIDLAITVYSFCLRYYEAFTETMYLAFIASALEQVDEHYSVQQFFGVLLRLLELEVVADENGAFEVYPVGVAGSDPGRDEGGQS